MKYQAGQLWTKGDDWAFVSSVFRSGTCEQTVCVQSSTMGDYVLPAKEFRVVFAGYALANPRGLREAAANVYDEITTTGEVSLGGLEALRTALEGSA